MNRTRSTGASSGHFRADRGSSGRQGPRPGTGRKNATLPNAPRLDQVAVTVLDEAELHRITGARPPSGVPVTLTAPVAERREGKGSAGRARLSVPRTNT
ncbi:hypothetical protein [Streptomyces sp. NPDC002671]